jgi:hypothetical protein
VRFWANERPLFSNPEHSIVRFQASFVLPLVAVAAIQAAPAPAPKPPDYSKLKPESIAKWSGAEVLISGKLASVIPGPVAMSEPPIYSFRINVETDKVLRGSGKVDQKFLATASIRQKRPPTFPDADKKCLIALRFVRDMWTVQSVEEMTEEGLEQAQLATSFPMGWTIKDNKLVSPWAVLGKGGKADGIACSVTGRPVLVAGDAVSFRAEPVPPAVKLKYGNPDGDGEFKLTVKNETGKEVEVPALLTNGKEILWNESIVIRCQDKNYPLPGSTGSVKGLKPVVLKPGESVSGKVHAFALNGPEWPMGGYRIEFQFCLGEKSATYSFYYLSKHHDPIRDAVQKIKK